MSKFLHSDDNDDAKAIAIPRVFSKNIRVKNTGFLFKVVKIQNCVVLLVKTCYSLFGHCIIHQPFLKNDLSLVLEIFLYLEVLFP